MRIAQHGTTPALWMIGTLSLLLIGCAHRVATPLAEPPSVRLPYLDLQAGWRLSIVSPLETAAIPARATDPSSIRSTAEGPPARQQLTLEENAPENFGYLQAWVEIRASGKGVRFRTGKARLVRTESTAQGPLPQSLREVFPHGEGVARLLFLTRAAEVEHDMALLQASTVEELDTLTNAILQGSTSKCTSTKRSSCAWVPQGVAIRAEKPGAGGAAVTWVPVL